MHRRTVLVTGGSGGVGQAVARRLTRAGWCVAITARAPFDPLPERDSITDMEVIHTDVSTQAGALQECLRIYGQPPDGLVNCAGPVMVAPGLISTLATEPFFKMPNADRQLSAQCPLGRIGDVEDVTHAVNRLLSDEASRITGQVLPVDGGMAALRPIQRSA